MHVIGNDVILDEVKQHVDQYSENYLMGCNCMQ
jgi:hypothetical protein